VGLIAVRTRADVSMDLASLADEGASMIYVEGEGKTNGKADFKD
jgi:hypothetical protein